jgi:ethanolamine utilization protein EutQ
MSGVKLFRREDQDFNYNVDMSVNQEPYSILAFANAGNSDSLGGEFGVFGAGSNVEWTVTYDELLFIHSGQFQLKVGDEVFHAVPGDTLWIPKDRSLTYIAEVDVWFFFAVYPLSKSPSASQSKAYPESPPKPAK